MLVTFVAIPTRVLSDVFDFAPPDPKSSFDEVDDATRQGEITSQVHTFLDNLHNHWGENPERLRTSIASRAERDEQGALVYLRNVGEHGVLEGYEFSGDSLVRGQYVIVQRPINGLNEFIDYYTVLKKTLTEVFGQPVQDRVVWDNDLYRPVPDYWGVAVMMGHLHYQASWETDEGTITLELTGQQHSRLKLDYKSYRAGVQI